MDDNIIKIGSLNCRGLSTDKIKRRTIFERFKKKRYDICVLLETHSTKEIEPYWLAEWGYKGIFASFKSNARGVSILFQNTFEHTIHKSVEDENVRFCILDITIKGIRFTLAAVYGPNEDNPHFFELIQQHLEEFDNDNVICTGDWNVVNDYSIDIKITNIIIIYKQINN
jgi:exonuclease III